MLSSIWVIKTYPVNGKLFQFIHGISAADMEKAVLAVTKKHTTDPRLDVGVSNPHLWIVVDNDFPEEHANHCIVFKMQNAKPTPDIKNFSIKDDRVQTSDPKKPLPSSIFG